MTYRQDLKSVLNAAKNDAVIADSQAIAAFPFAMQRSYLACTLETETSNSF
jgi:hypothetical protein